MHLAIFHVFPLQIVGILDINKKVCRLICGSLFVYLSNVVLKMLILFFQVFGNGVTDVVLSHGVLVVSYSNKSVKLYSFEHIVQRVGIFERVSCTLLRILHFYLIRLLYIVGIFNVFYYSGSCYSAYSSL